MATGKRGAERFQGNVLRYAETKAEREIRQQQEREEFEKPPKIGRLKTSADVAKYLARLIRRVEKNQTDCTKGMKLASMARMLSNTLELSLIEARLNALELHAKGLKQGQIERSEGDSDVNSEQLKGESGEQSNQRVNPDWQE